MNFEKSADTVLPSEWELIQLARRGDTDAFDQLVAPYRGELHVHCYRMLGSVQDAEDTLQDALLSAWRGLAGFEGRSSIRTWLYRITTNACLRRAGQRSARLLPMDYRAASSVLDLGERVMEPVWLQPYPETLLGSATGAPDPAARYELRESVELAFITALQSLPASQRAVLILRDVMAFSAAEVATLLDMTVASVNSALQRARASIDQRVGAKSQQMTLRDLGEPGRRELVDAFVAAWERADVPAMLDLLVEDARFSMPPFPAWFQGRDDIGRFMSELMFAIQWRVIPTSANGQLAFACYERDPADGRFWLGALNVLTLRGERIAEMTAFLDPDSFEPFKLPRELLR